MKTITQAQLKEKLHYNQKSGEFTWKVRCGRQSAGKTAGTIHSDGYIDIMFDGAHFFAHRLAWLYVHGEFPPDQIDHINRIKTDNRIVNLRVVTNSENQQNQASARSNSTSGFLGVSLKRGRWRAGIRVNGKSMHIGTFDTKEQAHAAYIDVKRQCHPSAPEIARRTA